MRRPRLMTAAVLVALVLASAAPASATQAPAAGTVVVVLAPYLTWGDIMSGAMPATAALADSGAVGVMNIRSSARFARVLSPAHVALTMSAGSPSAYDVLAPAAYSAKASYSTGTAGEAFKRITGVDPGPAEIVYLGLPRVLRANDLQTLSPVPGALGGAIVAAGGSTAAIGNSDGGVRGGEPVRNRPAAILAMDEAGRVRYGDISAALLREDAAAPFGLTTDTDRVAVEYRSALRRMDVAGGPALVVVDTGDMDRAEQYALDVTPAVAETHHAAALRTVDRVVELVVEDLPDDGVLMLVSNAQRVPRSGPSGFGPVVLAGSGLTGGFVASSSTHRLGLMTDLDVAATITRLLGVERPVAVLGNPVNATAGDESLEVRADRLLAMNATAVAVDSVRPVIQSSYIAITVIVLLVCAALLGRIRRAGDSWGPRAASAFKHVIVLTLAMPVSATLMYVFVQRPASGGAVVALFVATTAAVWAVASIVDRRWGSAPALALVGLLSAGVLLVDQLLGAPLSFSGLFSYSPLLGARYYGLGNEGASVVVGGALAGLALLVDWRPDERWTAAARSWGPALAGVAVVVISAAPFLGANVGVIAWGTVAFGILWLGLTGRRLTARWLVFGAVVIIGFVVAFSVYDLVSGSEGQTHLGRMWESASAGGIGEIGLIIARKAETNWRVLRATNWSILMIAILGFLGWMRWRPHGLFADTLARYPAFAVAMTAALWGSLAGYFTEDSGIVIPALVMLYITGSLLHLMLSGVPGEEAEAR